MCKTDVSENTTMVYDFSGYIRGEDEICRMDMKAEHRKANLFRLLILKLNGTKLVTRI